MTQRKEAAEVLKKSRRTVLLLFVLFFILFGGLSAWVIWSMSREAVQETDTVPQSMTAQEEYSETDARTLLLITEDEGEAQGFVLVRFDPSSARMRTLALPRETVAAQGGKNEKRLYELYKTQHGAGMETYIEQLTGFPLDFYAVLSYDGLEELLNLAQDGLTFTLPENLKYEMAGYTIQIGGGEQVLSATQVTDVLRYPAWNGGRPQRAAVQAQVISACINQYFTADAMQDDHGYEACIAAADTNVLREAYYASREALTAVASRNKGDVCQSLSVSGEYKGDGNNVRFYLDAAINPAVRSAFGAEQAED